MARPISWHKKIRAPEAALAFYEALVAAANAQAFEECHIFEGAKNNLGNPVFGAKGGTSTEVAAKVIGPYIGLILTGKRLCKTEGCLNPLHYQATGLPPERREKEPELDLSGPSDSDLLDLLTYIRDRNDIRTALPRAKWRELVPYEDLNDTHLDTALKLIPASWVDQ